VSYRLARRGAVTRVTVPIWRAGAQGRRGVTPVRCLLRSSSDKGGKAACVAWRPRSASRPVQTLTDGTGWRRPPSRRFPVTLPRVAIMGSTPIARTASFMAGLISPPRRPRSPGAAAHLVGAPARTDDRSALCTYPAVGSLRWTAHRPFQQAPCAQVGLGTVSLLFGLAGLLW